MKYLLTAFLLFVLSVPALGSEALSYEEMKSCNEMSYNYERQEARLNNDKQALAEKSRRISSLSSKLKGLDWDYNNAHHALEMCRIRNNHNDYYCQYEFNRLDGLAVNFNNTLSTLQRLEQSFNREADRYNDRLSNFKSLASRFDSQCFDKTFNTDDVKKVCNNSDTLFCNSIEMK